MQHMTAAQSATAKHDGASHIVYLRPGEGFWQARIRWERATGQQGAFLLR